MPKDPRIVVKQLTDGVVGWCDYCGAEIQIDPRQSDRQYLDTLIHELLHWVSPSWKERKVRATAMLFTREIWKAGYRRPPKTK